MGAEIVKAYTNMAVCNVKAKDWLAAKVDLEKALVKDGNNVKGMNFL